MGEAEAECEAARRYVRFARGAYVNAARAPRNAPPRAAARAAGITAARRYAPSLLPAAQAGALARGATAAATGRRSDQPAPWPAAATTTPAAVRREPGVVAGRRRLRAGDGEGDAGRRPAATGSRATRPVGRRGGRIVVLG